MPRSVPGLIAMVLLFANGRFSRGRCGRGAAAPYGIGQRSMGVGEQQESLKDRDAHRRGEPVELGAWAHTVADIAGDPGILQALERGLDDAFGNLRSIQALPCNGVTASPRGLGGQLALGARD